MGTIYDALDFIRSSAASEKDKGTKFERLCRFFLKNDPLWKARFSDVWMWANAPTNDGADIGIDLVARDREDGTYWAIQCKCLDDGATLEYKPVGTFYGKAGVDGTYPHTMLITTADRLSSHLETVADSWKTVRIYTDDMAQSEIDYADWIEGRATTTRVLKRPREHQSEAIRACLNKFRTYDRGKLIMACGTGKTITALRLTEALLHDQGKTGGRVLFLAPSIALVGQSMREWANQSQLPLECAVVCSDTKASNLDEDTWESSLRDLPYPASTDPEAVYAQMKEVAPNSLSVIFSTYQSIQVVSDAQRMGLPAFDLIICDEAHRTTGMVEQGKQNEASEFVKVHDNAIIHGKKRLYMTATPRIYGDRAVRIANADSYIVSSMDDEEMFGPEFYHLSFGRAIDEGLLTDYKVIALTVGEETVSEVYQRAMEEEGGGFSIPETAKMIGCGKGLLDQGNANGSPLKNAVAFCGTIAESRRMADNFKKTVDIYLDYEKERGKELPEFRCKLQHVDGTMDSNTRRERLRWLEQTESGSDAACRILSNARCLAEGVDVPNLDAVIFLQPKKSQIDIIQAVGRVMRKFEGKKYGYIILPIVIPAGMTAEQALDDNETYAVVWEVLKALRSHDERLDARINALPYDKDHAVPVVNTVDALNHLKAAEEDDKAAEQFYGSLFPDGSDASQRLQEAINALIVRKCGTKVYWDVWAKDIAEIARRHIQRIGEIVRTDENAHSEFCKFLRGLRDSLNESITEEQAVEMLAQHMITLPVFEALFAGVGFAQSNPVSIAMEQMLTVLRRQTLETESEKRELRDLYASVRMRAGGIRTDAGRQSVIKDLYESFFQEAFQKTSEKMGIVYTPNQVVDYILHATDRLLYREFGQHLCDRDVHILDAFTGTGTFIVDLIHDRELMPDEKLPYKYRHEIHCNEIMLLAYYIASINIEHAFHSRIGGAYESFPGAVLTDTFQMYEENDPLDVELFIENSERVLRQMDTPIHVLIGNPPWSSGQNNANENNANESYPTLDARIAETYVAGTQATNKNSLYDSYIRAFRWASDRIGEKGIVAFVTNGGWLRSDSANGFRTCLTREFSSIYVFDLRGNQRTQGEQSRKEGGKIFGSGSRAPVAITLLVKNPASAERGVIYYHDIGDYLTREDKLSIVRASVSGEPFEWDVLRPDRHGDWLEQRNDSWSGFAPMGLEKRKEPRGIFEIWSSGLKTERDVWAWNYSPKELGENIQKTILFYEQERIRRTCFRDETPINDFVAYDETSIKWNIGLLNSCDRNKEITFSAANIVAGVFRPFCKQWLYYAAELNGRVYQIPKLFPAGKENLVIVLSGSSALIANSIPDLHFVGDAQCFPLYWYEDRSKGKYIRHDAITDEALMFFRKTYPNGVAGRTKYARRRMIEKEDIFYDTNTSHMKSGSKAA